MDLKDIRAVQDSLNQQVSGANKALMDSIPGLASLTQMMNQISETPGVGLLPGLTGLVGPANALRALPMKERVAGLMESPLYLNMPLSERLRLVQGQGLQGRASEGMRRGLAELRKVGKAMGD